jgi:Acyltransferase family
VGCGTAKPSVFLGWFAYYAHSFRMELFFLLAGFFAALVIDKRGVSAFIRDRIRRILMGTGTKQRCSYQLRSTAPAFLKCSL